ncbi:MAG: type II secretion system F family protein [Alphaproteobacteria bacterium]|nr:type II secretion system F family protein [Alphaproteobacteria bacterium]
MTEFSYQAVNGQGKTVTGQIEADSKAAALDLITRRGLQPFRVAQVSLRQPLLELRLPRQNLSWRANFYLELSALLAAGVGLDRALNILAGTSTRKHAAEFLRGLSLSISSGASLSGALLKNSREFAPDEIGQIKAAELTGNQTEALGNLAQQLQAHQDTRAKIASALVYPAFLLALAPISLIIIATVLVPSLVPLFEDTKAPMPFALAAMVAMQHEIATRGFLWLAVAGGGALALMRALKSAAFLKTWSSWKYRLPLLGQLLRQAEAARFTAVFGNLLQSGAALQTALQSAAQAVGPSISREQILAAREKVMAGAKLAPAMANVVMLEKKTLQLIAIGEETNQLVPILKHVAALETKALTTAIERLITLLTPVLTIVMGLMVGGIVMSIMRAILSINQLASQ